MNKRVSTSTPSVTYKPRRVKTEVEKTTETVTAYPKGKHMGRRKGVRAYVQKNGPVSEADLIAYILEHYPPVGLAAEEPEKNARYAITRYCSAGKLAPIKLRGERYYVVLPGHTLASTAHEPEQLDLPLSSGEIKAKETPKKKRAERANYLSRIVDALEGILYELRRANMLLPYPITEPSPLNPTYKVTAYVKGEELEVSPESLIEQTRRKV